MSVRLENAAHVEAATEVEQLLVLVGGVDQDRLAGFAAAHHVDVVVDRTHHHHVDLGGTVVPDAGGVAHGDGGRDRGVVGVVAHDRTLSAVSGGEGFTRPS